MSRTAVATFPRPRADQSNWGQGRSSATAAPRDVRWYRPPVTIAFIPEEDVFARAAQRLLVPSRHIDAEDVLGPIDA